MRRLALAVLVLLGAGDARAERTEVIVLAAASLAEAFGEIETRFEQMQPRFAAKLSFGGSSALAAQLLEGARGDVFASADKPNMDKVKALLAAPPSVFAVNRLSLVVAKGNPKRVRSLADLGRPELLVVLGHPELPAGRYSAAMLERAGVKVVPRSLEPSVRAVVARVATGEADAGIAYATDLRPNAAQVTGVAIPDAQNERARYPIAVLRDAPQAQGAREFVDFVLGPEGQGILAGHGFLSP